jgi:hypothetical protein|nr:MAG TPA: hypothetical protein [Bacteriophage sp.]
MITKVEFYNKENGIKIIIPMNFDINTDSLNIDQRCLAYEELSNYVSDDFIHNTVIASAE